MYNFDQVIDRENSGSLKWDELANRYGSKDLLPMWVADMDFMSPPAVINAIVQRAQHGVFGYATRPDSYYRSIMSWMKQKYQWEVEQEWICFSPGIVPALNYIIETFTQPGDQVLVQPPVYHPFINISKKLNRETIFNPLVFKNGKYTIDFEDLRAKIKENDIKLFLFCSPHNPIGRVWLEEEIVELGRICIENNILVVSDEIHADLIYKGYTHIPFAKVSEEFAQNCIVCTSPSKTFNLAGLQTANLIIPNEKIRSSFLNMMDKLSLRKTNPFGIVATENAYTYGEEWLDSLMEYLKGNLDFLTNYLKYHIPEIEVIQPEATYLVWLDFRKLTKDGQELEDLLLQKAKVVLNQGYIFGPNQEGFARLNIACPRSILEEGLKRIKDAIESTQKFSRVT